VASVSAVFLAVVFAAAAVAKLRDRTGTAQGFSDLGLVWPEGLAWVVPGVELLVASVLLVEPGWGGVASFALLAGFTVVIVNTIVAGRQVPCRCFGGTSQAPVSWLEVGRNLWLLCLCAVASFADSLTWPSVGEWIGAAVLIALGPVGMATAHRRSKVAT
jgi:uncharacterized membrane protein YphA (DoxX/SURF4 family)